MLTGSIVSRNNNYNYNLKIHLILHIDFCCFSNRLYDLIFLGPLVTYSMSVPPKYLGKALIFLESQDAIFLKVYQNLTPKFTELNKDLYFTIK